MEDKLLMNNITKKLKEILTPEDMKALEEAIQIMVDEKTSKDTSLLVEEEKSKLEKASHEYVERAILEETEKLQNQLKEDFEIKKEKLEEEYIEKLDSFLEHEISENISDEVLNNIAINETYKPVVEGIKKIFAEQGLELDSDGSALLKEAHKEILELKSDVDRLLEENLELNNMLEKMSIRDIINDKTEGMLPEQKSRVENMFEGKSFEEVENRIDEFVEIVLDNRIDEDDDEEDDLLIEGDDNPGDYIKEQREEHLKNMKNTGNNLDNQINEIMSILK